MRITKACIDGYGRFSQRNIDFAANLQIILGPNEQGKSTLRSFIVDMLYGQKKSSVQRLYEDTNELRCPWNSPEQYGGRLLYQLDNGREIEVFRRFDRRTELVQVYDRTYARELTPEFEQLKNREPMFAYKHLGLTKEVFLNTATISHVTLDDLGDNEALAQIRERLLALADTGDERSSADAALRWLEARIAAIGQPAARTRPLPAARARLIELGRELSQATALRQELESVEDKRRAILDDIAALRQRRTEMEADLQRYERIERATRLRDARQVNSRIDEATQRCFALRGARDFPLDLIPDVHRAVTEAATARLQYDRTERERAHLQEQVDEERRVLEEQGAIQENDIPENYDQLLNEYSQQTQRLRDRVDDLEAAKNAAESRRAAAEQELANLPEFGKFSDDPVTWLNQLASSFRIAMRSRDEDVRQFETVKAQRQRLEAAISEPQRLFAGCDDFPVAAREYEVKHRMRDEMLSQLESHVEMLHVAAKDYGERIPGFGWMAVLTTALFFGLIVAAVVVANQGIYVAAALTAVAGLYFASSMFVSKAQTSKALKQIDEARAKSVETINAEDPVCKIIDETLQASGCENLRELEARYEQYHTATIELASVMETYRQLEIKAREADQRALQLFEKFRETLNNLGEEVTDPSQVEESARSAIGRYQLYRDARRRLSENREQVRRHEVEIVRVNEELGAALDAERDLSLEVRKLMRDRGYAEESKHDSAVIALRSYRIRCAQAREKCGRLNVLCEKLAGLEAQTESEREEAVRTGEILNKLLTVGKVDSVEEWHTRADQAKEYLEVRQRLADLQEQLKSMLRGGDFNELLAAVEADGPEPESPAQSMEELKQEMDALFETLDARRKEEHALHLALTERAAGIRSLSEIEEDRALTELRVRDLEFELEATTQAIVMIEDIARDRHARIAPRLATTAGEFLNEMTGGVYNEVLINRELEISVRIPQTQQLNDVPQKILSKGTVDQIYLALRLSMVQCLSENGETIPMLLDDPFANYDDNRLERTLELLARLGVRNQILLFTCREDVARAAEMVKAPVFRL